MKFCTHYTAAEKASFGEKNCILENSSLTELAGSTKNCVALYLA